LMAGLEEDPSVRVERATPRQLIEQLRNGELDAALVSTIEAVRRPGYRLLEGLGIACRTEVRSVRAFHRAGHPIRTVGLDASSATSVALLKILLAGPLSDRVDPGCTFETVPPTQHPDELPHDLVLLIGDTGLSAKTHEREAWDLGRLWRQWTGLPFVFAMWLLPAHADADRIGRLLYRARALARRRGVADGTFGAVHYDLDQDDMRGLQRFFAEARDAGLAERDVEPAFHGLPIQEKTAP